jgi:hypothetical protein
LIFRYQKIADYILQFYISFFGLLPFDLQKIPLSSLEVRCVFYVLFAADAVMDFIDEAGLVDHRAGVVGTTDGDAFVNCVLFLVFEDRLA